MYSGISQWYRVGDAGALRAEPLATLCLARSKFKQKTTPKEFYNETPSHDNWARARDWRALALTQVHHGSRLSDSCEGGEALSSVHPPAPATGKLIHNLLCDGRVKNETEIRCFCSPSWPVLGGPSHRIEVLVRVSLFCSTFAAFQRISPTPFPNPPNDSNSTPAAAARRRPCPPLACE